MKYIAVGFLLHFCLNRIVQVKTWDLVWLSSFGSKKIFKLLLMICIECFSNSNPRRFKAMHWVLPLLKGS